jgi:hypothetical protein
MALYFENHYPYYIAGFAGLADFQDWVEVGMAVRRLPLCHCEDAIFSFALPKRPKTLII